jgi:peroxiredoxin
MLTSRYIPWIMLATGGGLLIVLWTAGSHWTRAASAAAGPTPNDPATRKDHTRETHYVGPRQLVESNGMVQRQAGEFQAMAQDGRRLGWNELSDGMPVVLIFIKQGCPCSIEVEPFFQRIEKLYAGEVRFAGVIDADAEAAARYAIAQDVAHPILADTEQRLIGRFGAKNACYVVLLTPGGVIDGFWPGCSADTMRHLGQRIAGLAGVEERPVEVSGMPTALTTGCPFKS